MNEIEMKILDMSTVLRPSNSFALVLEEVGVEKRKLALIIGAAEAQSIKMGELNYNPPRPFTHDLMLSVIKVGGMGIYYSYLYIRRADGELKVVDARTSDVIALSLRARFPLYVYEDILEREQLRNISMDGSTYTLTVNSVDMDTLKKAMEEAVAAEDYERASQLRDEIRKREHEEKDGI